MNLKNGVHDLDGRFSYQGFQNAQIPIVTLSCAYKYSVDEDDSSSRSSSGSRRGGKAKMGISQKCRFACLFLSLITAWACDKTSLSITQQRTPLMVAGKPEWQVVVANTCDCPQSSIQLTCAGFSTTEDVDPSILRKVDTDPNYCILGDGKPIPLNANISFKYAWDDPFLFLVYASTLGCK